MKKRKKIKCAENRISLSYWTMQLASRPLRPLRPSATALSAVKSPIENDDSVALRITRKRLEAHLYHNGAKHPFILRPHFLQFLEIWFKKSGSRNMVREIWFEKSGSANSDFFSGSRKVVDQKNRWVYTINPREIWFEKSGWPEKKIWVWRTTFLEPFFYTFLEK